jgi:hypothetical protein
LQRTAGRAYRDIRDIRDQGPAITPEQAAKRPTPSIERSADRQCPTD